VTVALTGPPRPADGGAAESEWGYVARLTFYREQPLVEAEVILVAPVEPHEPVLAPSEVERHG
jgi:hypothetical protein